MSVFDKRADGLGTDRKAHWSDRAACKNIGEIMCPEGDDYHGIVEAQAICDTCKVHTECLTAAINTGDKVAVAAGYMPKERAAHVREFGTDFTRWPGPGRPDAGVCGRCGSKFSRVSAGNTICGGCRSEIAMRNLSGRES